MTRYDKTQVHLHLLLLLLLGCSWAGDCAPPPSPPPSPAMCSFGEDHWLQPNPSGSIAAGTLLSASPLVDTGGAAPPYNITPHGNVTYAFAGGANAISFDGAAASYLSLGNITFGGSPFSFSVWVMFKSAATSWAHMLTFSPYASDNANTLNLAQSMSSLSIYFQVFGAAGTITGGGASSFVLNSWVHVVLACAPPSGTPSTCRRGFGGLPYDIMFFKVCNE